MAEKKKGKQVSAVDAPRSKPVKEGSMILVGDSVRVWSEVGVTIAVDSEPPQFLRFTFGHERIAKNSTQAEIRKTASLVDEFNEAELERRLDKYRRMIRSVDEDDEDEDERPRKKAKQGASVKDRVSKRLASGGYS